MKTTLPKLIPPLTLVFIALCPIPDAAAAFAFRADGAASLSLDNFFTEQALAVTRTPIAGGQRISFADRTRLENAAFGVLSFAATTGEASVAPGTLKAVIGGETGIGAGAPNVPTITHGAPRVRANVGVSFTDEISVESQTLAAGTPVEILTVVDFSVSGNRPGHIGGQFSGYDSGTLFFNYFFGFDIGATYSFPNGLFLNVPEFEFRLPVVLSAKVGDIIPIGAALGMTADNRAGFYTDDNGNLRSWGGGNKTVIDASHTAELFLDALTPGVTLVSSSGHDYSASVVPLPPAWCLLATAAGLLRMRRTTCAVSLRLRNS